MYRADPFEGFGTFLVVMGSLFAIFGIVVGLLYLMEHIRSREQAAKATFVAALLNGLKQDLVNNLDELIQIYEGVKGLSSEDLAYRYKLGKWLREAIVDLLAASETDSKENKEHLMYKDKISNFIKEIDAISPYADLPELERSIISDISEYLQADNKKASKRKLDELASTIKARNNDFNKIRKINRYSLPLAIVGILLTILFGIWALFFVR